MAFAFSDSVNLWSINPPAFIRKVSFGNVIARGLQFTSDGSEILVGSWWGGAKTWNIATGLQAHSYYANGSQASMVAFSQNDKTVAVGSNDGSVELFEANTGHEIKRLVGNMGTINSVAFLPDTSKILIGTSDSLLRLWDIGTGTLLKPMPGNSRNLLTIKSAKDGLTCQTFSENGTWQNFDLATGKVVNSFSTSYSSKHAAFSPSGLKVAAAAANQPFTEVRIWDTETGKIRQSCNWHHAPVTSVAFSADGTQLLTAGQDSIAIVWDVK